MTPSSLKPVVACELEFYLPGEVSDLFWKELRAYCAQVDIGVFNIEPERGAGQFEIALLPSEWQKMARDISQVKAWLQERGADFSAKPKPDQPGSGLHVHVHLEDAHGRNVFFKDDARLSDELNHAIGGLLFWLPKSMSIFAPTPESYLRFVESENTPLTVSWGANNRTVAVRLPDSDKNNKRIEHRVAGADADAHQVIEVILAAMLDGIAQKREPGAQIYGNASLAQYGLPRLPATLEEARAIALWPGSSQN